LVDGDARGVRRPDQRLGIVVVPFRSVGRQKVEGAAACWTDGEVVVVNDCFEFAVGRLAGLRAVDVERCADRPAQASAPASASSPGAGFTAGVGIKGAPPRYAAGC